MNLKPKSSKFSKERIVNGILFIIFATLFVLNGLKIDFNQIIIDKLIIYQAVLLILCLYFLYKFITSFLYKIKITTKEVIFYHPMFIKVKKIKLQTISKIELENLYFILILSTKEAVKINLSKYSLEQRKELLDYLKNNDF